MAFDSDWEWDSPEEDSFYSVDNLEDAGYEAPEEGPATARILDEEWASIMLQYGLQWNVHVEIFRILRLIGSLPKMATTIRKKNWFAPTIELVAWIVFKRQEGNFIDGLDRAHRRELVRNGDVKTKWYLFGGPVRFPRQIRMIYSLEDVRDRATFFTGF